MIPDEIETPYPTAPMEIDFSSADIFNAAVAARVVHYLKDTDISDELLERLCILYPQWFTNMIIKYRDGQLEHGGDIRDRDTELDEIQEVLDLCNYKIAKLARNPTVEIKLDSI